MTTFTFSGMDWVVHRMVHVASSLFRMPDARLSVAITSCLAGGVYIAAAMGFAGTVARTAQGRAFSLCIFLSPATMLLFCGYVERYSLMTAALMCSARYLALWNGHSRRSLVLAAMAWLAACFFHPIAVFALPASLFAGLCQWGHARTGLMAAAIAILLVGLLVATGRWTGHSHAGLLLPLLPAHAVYSLLVPAHLLDMLNELLLIAPLQAALLVLALWQRHGFYCDRDPVVTTLTIALLCALGVSMLLNPRLGSMDWDLLSIYAVPLCALLARVGSQCVERTVHGNRIILVVGVGAFFHLFPWIWVNASREQAGGDGGQHGEKERALHR